MKPPYAIGSVPSLSGHAIAYRWRSLPRVRQHRASKPQGSSERVLPWQITMDQLIFASLSHTHCWYENNTCMVIKCHEEVCVFSLWNNNFIHVVKCPCGLVVKCKCIPLYQLQYRNIACVLDYKPLLNEGRCTITVYYYKSIILCTKNIFVFLLSGVPAWRLM